MRSTITALMAAAALSLAGLGAQAMPAQVATDGATSSPLLVPIAAGCGPGFAPGPAGVCRRIVVGRPVVVRRPIVRPGCGVRVGPIGIRTPC